MKNEEFKQLYLENSAYRNKNLKYYLTNQFKKVKPFEEELDKDLYDFTVKEIISFYKSLYCTSLETLMVLNNQLLLYTREALARSLVTDCQNHYEEIDNNVLANCINAGLMAQKIYTRKQLRDITFNMVNPVEKYIIFALFEGICGKGFSDLANLTMNDFKEDRVYLPSGKELTISKELYDAMLVAADEYIYYGYKQDGTLKEFKFKDGDEKIIKEMFNSYVTGPDRDRVRVYNRLMKTSKMYGLQGLTSKALIESGRIEMICNYKKESDLSVEEVISRYRTDIEYRYGKITSMTRYLVKYGEYIEKISTLQNRTNVL